MLGKWYYAVIPQKWNYAPENAGIMRSGQDTRLDTIIVVQLSSRLDSRLLARGQERLAGRLATRASAG